MFNHYKTEVPNRIKPGKYIMKLIKQMSKMFCLSAMFVLCMSLGPLYAQTIQEPDFIGGVVCVNSDSSTVPLNKEFGELRSGTSWKYNSWNALSLYVDGATSSLTLKSGRNIFLIKVADNNLDPSYTITLLRFDRKSSSRRAVLSLDNSGTIMASKTISDYKVMFDAQKYGKSSYLISVFLEKGEYGVVLAKPDGTIDEHPIVHCFTIK